MKSKFFLFSFLLLHINFLDAVLLLPSRQRTEAQQAADFMAQVEQARNTQPLTLERAVSRLAINQEAQQRYAEYLERRGAPPNNNNLIHHQLRQEEQLLKKTIKHLQREILKKHALSILISEACPLFYSQDPFFQHSFIKKAMVGSSVLETIFILKHHHSNKTLTNFECISDITATITPPLALHFGHQEFYGHKALKIAAITWAASRSFGLGKMFLESY